MLLHFCGYIISLHLLVLTSRYSLSHVHVLFVALPSVGGDFVSKRVINYTHSFIHSLSLAPRHVHSRDLFVHISIQRYKSLTGVTTCKNDCKYKVLHCVILEFNTVDHGAVERGGAWQCIVVHLVAEMHTPDMVHIYMGVCICIRRFCNEAIVRGWGRSFLHLSWRARLRPRVESKVSDRIRETIVSKTGTALWLFARVAHKWKCSFNSRKLTWNNCQLTLMWFYAHNTERLYGQCTERIKHNVILIISSW